MNAGLAMWPIRVSAWNERGSMRWVWDYRRDTKGVPFLSGNSYFENFDHYLEWSGEKAAHARYVAERERRTKDQNQPTEPDRSWGEP